MYIPNLEIFLNIYHGLKHDKMSLFKNLKARYKSPTPKFWVRLGNTLLGTAMFLGAGGLLTFDTLEKYLTPTDIKILIFSIMGVGTLGKILTLFFVEKTEDPKP